MVKFIDKLYILSTCISSLPVRVCAAISLFFSKKAMKHFLSSAKDD
ncbi:hypothetical protein ATN83_0526 [Raoultella ornithinolytica]|nr:hypothetical protein ATN83_0526 [Raoultella ornithinolytica]KDV91551.1 hypothetical protein AB00_4327 [Raoultella ornithinolytica 2-156-04_S1_C1]KDX11115.1 hypothetical protein AB28_4327 [Raoultella ornithinolytica 2-156-04_S1_C2]